METVMYVVTITLLLFADKLYYIILYYIAFVDDSMW